MIRFFNVACSVWLFSKDTVEVVLAYALGNHVLVHPADDAFQSGDAFAVLVNAPLDSLTLGLLVVNADMKL